MQAGLRLGALCTRLSFELNALFQSLFGPLFMNTVHEHCSQDFSNNNNNNNNNDNNNNNKIKSNQIKSNEIKSFKNEIFYNKNFCC